MILNLILVKISLKIDADHGSINTIGDLKFDMGNLVSLLKLKQLDNLYPGNLDIESIDNDLNFLISNLKLIREKLSDNANLYSRCSSIESLYGKILNINELNGKFTKVNIVNYLKIILMHVFYN